MTDADLAYNQERDFAKGIERLSHIPEAAFEGLVEGAQTNTPAATHA